MPSCMRTNCLDIKMNVIECKVEGLSDNFEAARKIAGCLYLMEHELMNHQEMSACFLPGNQYPFNQSQDEVSKSASHLRLAELLFCNLFGSASD